MKKLSRRNFIHAGCLVVAATFVLSPVDKAQAWLHGERMSPGFYGNPNVSISAINTSPSTVVVTGTTNTTNSTSSNSKVINGVSSLTGLLPGMLITDSAGYIPANTTIAFAGLDQNLTNVIVLSQPATGIGSTTLTCGGNAIACSRLTGQTPAFFQVSAAFITATGTSYPFEDLQFSWNFGDPTGTETFVRPTDGVVLNANSGQICANASYVYRNAGPYTITLKVTGKSSSGYISATTTQQVNVTAFSPGSSLFFDINNGSDTNNGTSSTTPKRTLSAIQTFITANPSGNIQINCACGSTWAGSTTLDFNPTSGSNTNGVRMSSYVPPQTGVTTQPVFNTTSGNGVPTINLRNGTTSTPAPRSDYVFTNIAFMQSAQAINGAPLNWQASHAVNFYAPMSDIHLDNCLISANHAACDFSSAAGPCVSTYNRVFWNSTFETSSEIWTVTGAADNGSGKIRITVGSTADLLTGQRITLTGAVMAGATVINNSNTTAVTWTITVVGDGVSVDLNGSTFVGGDSWVSGGSFSQTPNGPTGSARLWQSWVGCTYTGNGVNVSQDHFMYPETQTYSDLKWGNFSPNVITIGKNEISNMRWNGYNEVDIAQYMTMTENSCNGVSQVTDLSESTGTVAVFVSGSPGYITLTSPPNAPAVGNTISFTALPSSGITIPSNFTSLQIYYIASVSGSSSPYTITVSSSPTLSPVITVNANSTGQVGVALVNYYNIIIERNSISNFYQGKTIAPTRVVRMTVRDNRSWGCGYNDWFSPDGRFGPLFQGCVYRNKIYLPNVNAGCYTYNMGISGFIQPQQFTDNMICNEKTNNGNTVIACIIDSDQIAAGSLIDRNTYSVPSGYTQPWLNGVTWQTYSQWQNAGTGSPVFDVNGTNLGSATPAGWTIPPTSWASFGP